MPDTVDTVLCAPDDGWRYHPKHVEQLTDINKLYSVASCWAVIATYYTMHGPLNIKNLPVVWCGCGICCLILREEHRLGVFENRALRKMSGPKKDEVQGEWRKLHKEELCEL